MGLFDGILGGFIGGEMASLVNGFIRDQGGVSGLVTKFQNGGLGTTVNSWVGTGPNAPVSADQVHQVLGPDVIQQLAMKTGLSTQEVANKLSQFLPELVDKLTPGGVIPKN